MIHPSAPLLAGLLLLLAGGAARAQVESREGITLQNQILDLRRQVQILQDQGGRGGGAPVYSSRPSGPPMSGGDLVPQLLSRVDTLEEQVRQLRGRIDEMQNQMQRQNADLAKRMEDLAFQSQNPPGGGRPPGQAPAPPQQGTMMPPPSSLGGPSSPPAAPPMPPAGPVRRTPELSIQEGNAALARRDYAAAEQAAREVLTNYRTSPRAYDAQFLLAQSLVGQRQYSQAVIAYDDTYNRSKKGSHAPDALLGLASSLIAINERRSGCEALGRLRTEFPTLRPDVRDEAAAAAQRGGCR